MQDRELPMKAMSAGQILSLNFGLGPLMEEGCYRTPRN